MGGERDGNGNLGKDIMEANLKPSTQSSSGIEAIVSAAHQRHLANRAGALADYIPELASVDPDRFGIALATVDGKLIAAGDADHQFTIQSISKAFVYCLALELVGRDTVIER